MYDHIDLFIRSDKKETPRTRSIVGGNLLDNAIDVITLTADLTTVKIF